MNRMDDWIEARLMNAKKNKNAVSTKDLIAEISIIFNLKTSRQSIRNLKEKIKTIRNRVNKKCARQKQTCERYARKLFVPNEMIQRWVENGLFPIQNPRKIERIMKVIEERDYFREALSNTARRLYNSYRKRNAPDKVTSWARTAKSISFCGYKQ